MIRHFAFIAALAVAGVVPLTGGVPVAAQESAACASAFWLEPLATAASDAGTTAASEGTEPAPAWMTTDLTDACAGETFALADFRGKTLFIESMATWCTNCHAQLTRVKEAVAQIPEDDRDDIVFVVLSSEVDLPRETLAEYAASNDFPFIFAVMSADMLRSMAEDLGQEIAVPPAMPHLIVAPDGTIGDLHTGGSSPEELLALFAAARASSSS